MIIRMNSNKTIFVVAVLLFFLSIGFVNAEEKQKTEGWKPGVEIIIGAHSGYVDELLGSVIFNKQVFTQSATVSIEKNGTGFYLQADNFSPSEQESRETDFYAGFYTEIFHTKIDIGYAYYWWREDLAINFHGIYGSVVFPSLIWQISPFVNAEYRIADKKISEENLSGFLYYGGLRRDFKVHDRVNLMTEISLGGNTGIYGMEAENLSFAREKLEVTVSLLEQLKLKFSGLTQQNLGKKDGIAADTDKIFVSAAIVLTL